MTETGDERHEAKLQQLIREEPLPRPREEFRRVQRERFLLAGSAEEASRAETAPRRDSVMSTPLEELIARAPLAEPARPAFRANLERRFLELGGADLASGDGSSPQPALPRPSRLRRVVVLVLAAAAALLVTLLPREPAWQLVEVDDPKGLVLGGVPIDRSDLANLGSELSRGADLSTGETTLELELPSSIRLRIRPGTELTLAALPEMGSQDAVRLYLAQGEIFLETLEGHPRNPIRIETAESRIEVTGTAVGVLRDELGTCTCVAHGVVHIEDLKSGAVLDLGGSRTHFVFRDPAIPATTAGFDDPLLVEHTGRLVEFSPER